SHHPVSWSSRRLPRRATPGGSDRKHRKIHSPKTLLDIPKDGSALAPSPITSKSYGDVDGKTVFGYVREMLKQLKGTATHNTISGWAVPEVKLSYTLPATKKSTNPYV
ncbi:hypothetical protein AB0M36_31505, partial [Actinoplanes sp. NPDC051346]|uniref:hypothetical protein n=1 Tax=Actinoplanes sp. NPDC051346 TaxID=3155048 RepID=UPI003439773A